MRQVVHLGAFTKESRDIINANFVQAGFGTVGNVAFLDPVRGYDASAVINDPTHSYNTLAGAYAACVAGQNDVVLLSGDGATTGTARVDAAFTWAKNATHLLGVAAPSYFSQRARIAPTGTTTAFANFFTVSGNGCLFKNVQLWHGFNTGVAASIALTVSGARNAFINCHIAGMGDAASAQSATSRCVKLTGDENYFSHSVIGVDTVTRTQANASVEFSGGTGRNVFEDCIFPFMGSAAGVLGIKVASAAGSDRWQNFIRCKFENAILSTSTTMAALSTLAASMGGGLLFEDCYRVGITDWGTDATSNNQIYVIGKAGVSATAGFVGDDIGRAMVAIAS